MPDGYDWRQDKIKNSPFFAACSIHLKASTGSAFAPSPFWYRSDRLN